MRYRAQRKWPEFSRDAGDILKLFGEHATAVQKQARSLLNRATPVCSLDLEFNDNRPTILGLSDGVLHISVPWEEGRSYLIELMAREPDIYWIGHFLISADVQVLAKEGINLYRQNVSDTAIWHWLTAMHLCKGTGKTEDGQDKRGKGYMNLWAFASLHTNLANWKGNWKCRGEEDGCDGEEGTKPCPVHRPFAYNATDAAACMLALPSVVTKAKFWRVTHLHDLHRDLLWSFSAMTGYGVKVDMPYVAHLRTELAADKLRIEQKLPFNPKSAPQVLAHFKAKGILLTDNQEETIREAMEEDGVDDAELNLLLEHKELGAGPDRWVGPKFVGEDERIHCRLGAWTSSGRMMAADPNLNNVGKRRVNRHQCKCGHAVKLEHVKQLVEEKEKLVCVVVGCGCKSFSPVNVGKKFRRMLVASPGFRFIDADLKNGENRVYLYLAGYEAPNEDFHDWMTTNIGIDNSHPFAMALGSARDAAKSVTHAVDYGEGLQLRYASELRTARIKKEIDAGARTVFPEWTFRGKVVTFTGVNMARRAFGSATLENRRAALDIAERYMSRFPKLRELQQRIMKQVEQEGGARPPNGYLTKLYGTDEDVLKSALAIWGSQPVAHILKLSVVQLQKAFGAGSSLRPLLPIHDEMLCEAPEDGDATAQCRELQGAMEQRMSEMPGMLIPADPSHGPSWSELKKLAS